MSSAHMVRIKFQRFKEREQHFGHIGLLSYSQGSDVTAPIIRCLAEYDRNVTPLSPPEYIQ